MAAETFKERDWRPGTDRRIVATITLSDPETLRNSNYTTTPGAAPVLYLCDAGSTLTVDAASGQNHPLGVGTLYKVETNLTNDDQHYYPMIEDWSVDCGSTGHGIDYSDATCSLTLLNHRYVWQKINATTGVETDIQHVNLSQLFASYLWHGATVQLAIVAEQYSYSQNPSAGADYHAHVGQVIFTGKIVQFDFDEKRIYLQLDQDMEWNRPFPDSEVPAGGSGPSVVDAVSYPNAPRQSIGATLPFVFTRRGPTAIFAGFPNFISPYLLDGLIPAICTTYNSSTSVSVKLIGDKWSQHGSAPATTGNLYYIDLGDNLLASLVPSGNSTVTELSVTLDHDDMCIVPIPCNRYQNNANTTNPTRAIDGKPDTYAVLANAGATAYINMYLPTSQNHGFIETFATYCVFETGSVGAGATDGTVAAKFGLYNLVTGAWALPTTESAQNPRELTKLQVNALGNEIVLSSTWAEGTDCWDAANQPLSDWRWEERNLTTSVSEQLVFRVEAVTNGTTLNVIAGGVRPAFYPFLSLDFNTGQIVGGINGWGWTQNG